MNSRMVGWMVAATFSIFGFSAHAADIDFPYMNVPPPLTWGGLYVGANLGGVFGVETAATPLGSVAPNPSGLVGGGQLGYNFMLSPSWLLGVEGEFDWTSAQGNTVIGGPAAASTLDDTHNWYGTLDARLGFVQTNWLYYLKGGAAWMDANYKMSNGVVTDNLVSNRVGWTVGAGVEYMFPRGWSAKLEYDYLDFGNQSLTFPNVGSTVVFTTQVHEIKLGVNYHWFP
jgi:outer membrane autotransporter protein